MNITRNKNKFLPSHREKWLYAWWIITLDTLNRNGQTCWMKITQYHFSNIMVWSFFCVCLFYFIKPFCLNFTYKLLVVAKAHLDLVFLLFHSQADSANNPPLPQTFLHPQKAQHNPQNLELYRFQYTKINRQSTF